MDQMSTLLLLMLLPFQEPVAASEQVPATSCLQCHQDTRRIAEPEMRKIVEGFAGDVHAEVGLSCHDCHGGNPDPALGNDKQAAKDAGFQQNPYRGVPQVFDIPGFCGSCHSDSGVMRTYSPGTRIDQESQYWTSRHGIGLAAGDANVATCVSCHSTHGVLRVSNSESPVHPTNVAETCRQCHENANLMADYSLESGQPMAMDQYSLWQNSVHGRALLEKGDLFAPTCNDCHGNHGAAPPTFDSVAFVCGSCHPEQARLFRSSPKQEAQAEHNDVYLPAMEEGCVDCHEDPEQPAFVEGIHSFTGCVTCHGEHQVVRATLAQLSPHSATPCAICHEDPDPSSEEPEEERLPLYEETRDALLSDPRAPSDAAALFDWLVDQAQQLDSHTVEEPSEEGAQRRLRPEFEEIFRRFRIGKNSVSYLDPVSGPSPIELRGCDYCHSEDVASDFLRPIHELTVAIGRAERMLVRARRGGVQIRGADLDLGQAIDAKTGLDVLLHAFSTEEGSEFAERHDEGMAAAREALRKGREAVHELSVRRQGLVAFLVIVLIVLVGLGLKIRSLSAPN